MKIINSIQLVAFLMASPTLLALCYNASFQGARPLFYVGVIATIAAAWASIIMILSTLEREK